MFEFGAFEAEVGRTEADVLLDGWHEELIVGILKDESEPSPDLAQGGLIELDPSDLDRPSLGLEDPDQQQQQRRLAGAVGTEHGHPLTGLDLEVHAVDGVGAIGVRERRARRPPLPS